MTGSVHDINKVSQIGSIELWGWRKKNPIETETETDRLADQDMGETEITLKKKSLKLHPVKAKLCLGRNSQSLIGCGEAWGKSGPGAPWQQHPSAPSQHEQKDFPLGASSPLTCHLIYFTGRWALSTTLHSAMKGQVRVSYNNDFLCCSENESPWTPNSCDLVFWSVGGLSAEMLAGRGKDKNPWGLDRPQTGL